MPIFLYYGAEKVRLSTIKKRICQSCRYPEFDLLDVDSFSNEVIDFAECISMLGGNRVVIIRLSELKSDDNLLKFVKKGTAAQVYIIADHVDRRSRIFEVLKKASKELSKFTVAELYKNMRSSVSPDVISDQCLQYLIDASGYASDEDVSLDTINIYMSQLMLLKRKITEDDIQNIVHRDKPGQIWFLWSYISKKDIARFLKEYTAIDSNDIGILSLMLRNARLGYKACICRQMGMTEKEIAGKLNVNAAAIAFSKNLSSETTYQMMHILQCSVNAIKEGQNPELIAVTTASRLINLF